MIKAEFDKMKQFWGETAVSSELDAIVGELKLWEELKRPPEFMAAVVARLEQLHTNAVDYAAEQIWAKAEALKHSYASYTYEQKIKDLENDLWIAKCERAKWRNWADRILNWWYQ